MSKVQIITSPSGEQMVVLSKEEFDLMAANQFDEDAETLRIYRESMAAIERGEDIALPEAVWDRLEARESPVRVLREFRSMTQKELAEAAGISQSYLSEIERGAREGTLSTIKAIAKALAVPLTVLTEDY
ncbi:helix-turn-helix domain-containing protein [uncultured Nisaea sp.]|uniref:helix-turn-helix domain-containing protein n=1 Tax=uncultured Nisaea sp. TaxID=538215 RepID=UPI0030EC10CC|tara:strand:+ start:2246 stop:2635 length:390 start_codon:yes stop_codon:yes gene_type:complete